MTSPRTKKMLLLAVTVASPVVVACSNDDKRTGFYGEVAYDAGYEDPAFGPGPVPDASGHPDADARADAEDRWRHRRP